MRAVASSLLSSLVGATYLVNTLAISLDNHHRCCKDTGAQEGKNRWHHDPAAYSTPTEHQTPACTRCALPMLQRLWLRGRLVVAVKLTMPAQSRCRGMPPGHCATGSTCGELAALRSATLADLHAKRHKDLLPFSNHSITRFHHRSVRTTQGQSRTCSVFARG